MAGPIERRRSRRALLIGTLGLVAATIALAASLWAPRFGLGAATTSLKLKSSSVKPRRAFFDGPNGVRIAFGFRAEGPRDVSLRLLNRGRIVARFTLDRADPGITYVRVWDGRRGSGKPGPEGAYSVSLKPKGAKPLVVGRFSFHHYLFPVRGRHGTRGAIGEFGAPRSGERRHEGFDVTAACGTRLVAARGGTVVGRGYDPVLYGNFALIHAAATRRNLFYAHMIHAAAVGLHDRVHTGQTLGRIGRTGNARTTPCHLHFEIRARGHPIDPEPYLRRWDRYS